MVPLKMDRLTGEDVRQPIEQSRKQNLPAELPDPGGQI